MKRFLLLLALAALSVGCDPRDLNAFLHSDPPYLDGVQGFSTEPTTWREYSGTAVTIRFAAGTELFEGAQDVTFDFVRLGRAKNGEFLGISDFTVPVLKLEPRAVMVFFFANSDISSTVLRHPPEQVEAKTLRVIPCDPAKVCGGNIEF